MLSTSSRRCRAGHAHRGLSIERLESRQLLSVAAAVTRPTPTVAHHAVIQETEGAAFTGATVATFSADPASTYTATINWGDKSTTSGSVVVNGSGSFTVTGAHDYLKAGTYLMTVKITNQSSKTTSVFSTAKVADAALAASPISITATRNSAFSGNVATFTDADPNAVATPRATEIATINWGDGTSSVGTITQATAGGPFTVAGKHTYGVAKTFTVTVTIRDVQGGAKATAVGGAVVSPPAPVTSPSLIGDYKGSVKIGGLIGSFTGSHSFELNITAQDINGITGQVFLSGDEIASGTFGANGVGELSNGNFEFSQTDGSITVTISGHISPDSQHITSGFVKGSGLPFVGSIHGTFTLTKQ